MSTQTSTPMFSLDDLLTAHTRTIAAKDAEIAALKLEVAAQTQFAKVANATAIKAIIRRNKCAERDRTAIENLEYALSREQQKTRDVQRQLQDAQGFGRPYVLYDSPTVTLKFTMAQEDWAGVNLDGSPRNPDELQKIPTIKLMRKLAGLGLKEAKDLAEGTTELRTHAAWLSEVRDNTGLTVQQWLDRVRDGYTWGTTKFAPVKFILNVTEGRIHE